ncbi:MAG: T9SS type A sorting domain-containing protein [Bacteroidota bacterium]
MQKRLQYNITLFITVIFFVSGAYAMPITNALKLKISNSAYSDETVIRYLHGATSGFDGSYDAWKLFSSNAAVPNIYTMIEPTGCLSINAYSDLLKDEQVQLYTAVGSTGAYTITSTEIGAFISDVDILIENIETGYFQNLRTNPVFTFNVSDPEIFNTNKARFKIHFSLPVVFKIYNPAANNNCIVSKKGIDKWVYVVKDNFNNVVASANKQTDVDTLRGLSEGTYFLTSYFGNINTNAQTFNIGGWTRLNDQPLYENYKLFLDDNNLIVDFNNVQQNTLITIFTIEGREVAKAQISDASKFIIPLNEKALSIYIVKVQTSDTIVIKKVIVGLLSKR